MQQVGSFIMINCDCGRHIVDLFAVDWNGKGSGFYSCNDCDKPLVCQGNDGRFYIVGERVG